MTHTCSILMVSPETYRDIRERIMRVNQRGDYDSLFHGVDKGAGQGIDLTGIMIVAEKPGKDG